MPPAVIRACIYEARSQILTITFVSGRSCAYLGVPAALAEDLERALAKGPFFNSRIRDRYPARAVEPGTEVSGRPPF
ncbi:KTSC domain-containing protein [Caulobacter hibisci]|uniref:KTSC domain-containing protein n=1 Tax=Caulobacter hibisci TaxID=2035993 RepID=A0ABS0T000_9CAUL|nr:KTSC domain-containing protein [Caulobacter hibisci]MBI1685193.1 KTSC domain-containing protein [Caulobacter hibisci]